MKLRWHKTTTKVFGDKHIKNEDVMLCATERGEHISRFVMCDGATSSYSARAWAESLVANFARPGDVSDKDRVYAAAKEYEAKYPPSSMAGMDHCTIEAFKRGSSATLLLVEQDGVNRDVIHVTSVGDTCLFVVGPDFRVQASFPLSKPEEFSTSAYLITVTFEGLKQLFDPQTSAYYWKRCDIDMREYKGSFLLCATDAVSQWITAHKDNGEAMTRLVRAVKAKKRSKFVGFIEYERGRKNMPVDDSTVAILET